MTDTPGWVSPGSSQADPADARSAVGAPAGPDSASAPSPAAAARSTDAAPVDAVPSDAAAPAPSAPSAPAAATAPAAPSASAAGPYSGAYGDPGARIPQRQPAPGWGQPGWGQPQWNAQPPSPKPGVIPLRPLGVGEILDGSISTGRKHWRTVLPLSLVVAVLSQGTATAFDWFSRNDSQSTVALVLLGAGALVTALCGLVLSALLTMVVSKAILGEPVTAGSAWRAARPQMWRLLGLTLLIGLICAGIAVLGMVPAIIAGLSGSDNSGLDVLSLFCALAALATVLWMYIKLSLAAPALMLEKQGVKAAMARSSKLTRGNWWRIFGITALGFVLTTILSGMIAIPFTALAGATGNSVLTSLGGDPNHQQPFAALLLIAIGGVLSSTLTAPVQAGINVLLYVDQRIRREALDLELARAAGLPEYGGTGWAGRSDQQPSGAA
ncbi:MULTISPECIES: DUF7544 domain-containing protein [Kitasatospora]|uniref:DUF7544 domain-containing protein n=1 Tax=Kitasatospora TaxID=2063 RepID=UPI000C7146F0|nr:glycerophosphoryl diester phosphodiesterase membrane domain-containing protein [Kitasatospora sp. GP30]MDH6142469.1 hypothetical protein [Kitasatospora sp. GP30]